MARTVSAAIRGLRLADAVGLLLDRYPDAAVVAASWADADGPVTLDGGPTGMRAGDFGHCDWRAVEWARRSSTRLAGGGVIVVDRWYDLGEWATTARRYR